METITKDTPVERRLAQLEAEGQNIIDTYLKQVIVDANSMIIKNLQNKLKEVRAEQWMLFEKQVAYMGPATRLSEAA